MLVLVSPLSCSLFNATSVGQPVCDAIRRTGFDSYDGVDGGRAVRCARPVQPAALPTDKRLAETL